jgi:pyruvate/2-oxoglutarate dehydrogenase complex dihydrolipoamide dehydrogenase (E3) component
MKKVGIEIKTQAEIVAATEERDGLHVDLSSKDGRETSAADNVIPIERGATLKDLGLKSINLDEHSPNLR